LAAGGALSLMAGAQGMCVCSAFIIFVSNRYRRYHIFRPPSPVQPLPPLSSVVEDTATTLRHR